MSRHMVRRSQIGSFETLSPADRNGLAKKIEIIGSSTPFFISKPQEIGWPSLSSLRKISALDGLRRGLRSFGGGVFFGPLVFPLEKWKCGRSKVVGIYTADFLNW